RPSGRIGTWRNVQRRPADRDPGGGARRAGVVDHPRAGPAAGAAAVAPFRRRTVTSVDALKSADLGRLDLRQAAGRRGSLLAEHSGHWSELDLGKAAAQV